MSKETDRTTFGSVCSGIEAASMAWHPLGWRTSWLSEIDRFPSELLAYHYPDTPNLGDMTEIAGKIRRGEVEAPDVIVGGTPCQSWSLAGLRSGRDDPRGELTFQFLEIVDAAKPKFVIWENVPGIISADGGKHFADFMDAVLSLGYIINADILDAQFFGVAQRRRRVFLACHRADILMSTNSATSQNTGVIAVLGILRSILAVHRAELERKRVSLDAKCESVGDGLRRKISCFLAHGEEVYLPWLERLAELLQSVAPELECSVLHHGLSTKTEEDSKAKGVTLSPDIGQAHPVEKEPSSSTSLSWKSELEGLFELAKSSTTSTQLKTTTETKISTYAEMLATIGRYICRSKSSCPTYCKMESLFLTLNQEFISYARQSNKQIHGRARFSGFWADFIEQAERSDKAVASARTGPDPAEILFEFEGVRRDTPPSRIEREEVAGTLASRTGEGNLAGAGDGQPACWWDGGQISQTLDAVSLRGRDGGATAEVGGDVATALRASSGGGDKPHVLAPVADTLTSHWHNSNGAVAGNNSGMINPVIYGYAVRRLMPKEAERLQGFPDDWTRIPWRNKPATECPDGHRYKAIGNSMAVPVMRWIGERINKWRQ